MIEDEVEYHVEGLEEPEEIDAAFYKALSSVLEDGPQRLMNRRSKTCNQVGSESFQKRFPDSKINIMSITIELPDEIEHQLSQQWKNLPRRTLEALAAEGYRTGALTRGQVGEMLGLDFWETEAFLKEREAYLHYSAYDLELDHQTHDRVLPKRS